MPAQPVIDDDTGPLSPTAPHRLTAVVQLPFQQRQQATAALRGELRYQLTERLNVLAGEPLQVMDFDTLTVDGPTVQTEPGGRAWFIYTGTAVSRLLRPIDEAGPGQSGSGAAQLEQGTVSSSRARCPRAGHGVLEQGTVSSSRARCQWAAS